MKLTPSERKQRIQFGPGHISRDGFMGNDPRHIHDIVEADQKTLDRLKITREQVADCLQYFIDEGKQGLESLVDLGRFTVLLQWDRGMMPCPFGQCSLQHKIVVTVTHKEKKKTITYSQLNVHMIRKHGFFEGKGGHFRLDPEEIVPFLCLTPYVRNGE